MSQPAYFVDDRHALFCGWVMARALEAGLDVEPVRDADGNYTDRLELSLPKSQLITAGPTVHRLDAVTITLVVPYPPDEWQV